MKNKIKRAPAQVLSDLIESARKDRNKQAVGNVLDFIKLQSKDFQSMPPFVLEALNKPENKWVDQAVLARVAMTAAEKCRFTEGLRTKKLGEETDFIMHEFKYAGDNVLCHTDGGPHIVMSKGNYKKLILALNN